MKKYLIGSRALKEIFPNFHREPKDYDYLVEERTPNIRTEEKIEEFHVNPVLLRYVEKNGINGDVLLTLKCSHMFWDIFWSKHMYDIVFMFENGAKIIEPLFYELYEYWNKIHGKNKRSDLEMSAEDFFNNALKTYNHDELHTYINPTPTYLKVLKDGAEVEVDENKFNKLTFEEKVDLVQEEVFVMAYERRGKRDYRVAYNWMLKKFIMNHAPMYETLFIFENYRHIQRCPYNYVEKIDNGLKNKNKKQEREYENI